MTPVSVDNGVVSFASRKGSGSARIAAIPGDGIGQEVIAAGLGAGGAANAAPELDLEVRTTGARITSAAPGA